MTVRPRKEAGDKTRSEGWAKDPRKGEEKEKRKGTDPTRLGEDTCRPEGAGVDTASMAGKRRKVGWTG